MAIWSFEITAEGQLINMLENWENEIWTWEYGHVDMDMVMWGCGHGEVDMVMVW